MDSELTRTFLKQAQQGEHLRRLMVMDEWATVEKLIKAHIQQYDTVRGIRADKEFLIRASKVEALEELLGAMLSIKMEAETAMEELTTRDEFEA
jgi:hypothetical protein